MSTPDDSPISIQLNGKARELPPRTTLSGLAGELGLLERNGIAMAVNQSVVSRGRWPQHTLAPGDQVLVIQATQGG